MTYLFEEQFDTFAAQEVNDETIRQLLEDMAREEDEAMGD